MKHTLLWLTLGLIVFMILAFGIVVGFTFLVKLAALILVIYVIGHISGYRHKGKVDKRRTLKKLNS